MANPKCIVFRAQQQGKTLTDADLTAISQAIPLAASCIDCPLRRENKLSAFCYISL